MPPKTKKPAGPPPQAGHEIAPGFGITTHAIDTQMSGKHFGGISLTSNGRIGKTYLISPNGVQITKEDAVFPGFADAYSGGMEQACSDIATRMSEAAGKIFVEICRCTGLKEYGDEMTAHRCAFPFQHPEVSMSGFWVQGSRFVTCAHFLDVFSIPEDQKENTIAYQKFLECSVAGRMKAVVSSDDKVPRAAQYVRQPISVYLAQLDRASDLAVFKAYDDLSNARPPRGLFRSEITTMARCDTSMGAFNIGYYGPDVPLQGLTSHDHQTIKTFWPNDSDRPRSYFQVKYAGATGQRDDSISFRDVFEFPNHRTLATGGIGARLGSHGSHSSFVSCQITAWFQGSGGMVGGFSGNANDSNNRSKPVVFGVLRGDQGAQNCIAAFTEAGIDWLFN